MGKSSRERSLADNEAKAVARMLRVSPQKLNLVAQLIRGKKAASALADLQFSRKRIAKDVRKCLESAIANAENNHDLDVDDLIVAEAHVGKALVIKRYTPRGRGRVGRIFKSSCRSCAYSPLLANQRESQVRLMPTRSPIGLTF